MIGQFVYRQSYHAQDAIEYGDVNKVDYFGDLVMTARSDIDSNNVVKIVRLSEIE